MKDSVLRKRLYEHWEDALKLYPEERIVALVLQGSQNYGLNDAESDVDTKLLLVPTLDEIIFNKKPVSTTHVRENDEHIDAKDIRLYWQCFRKGNPNFVEVLFTDYYIVNPMYADLWEEMRDAREQVARVNPLVACKAMMGMVQEKYHAMEHRYPSRAEIVDKFGYDPKQLQHLIRMADFLEQYVNNVESYKNILTLQWADHLWGHEFYRPWLMRVKRGKEYDLEEARKIAADWLLVAEKALAVAKEIYDGKENEAVSACMDEVLGSMIKRAVRNELQEEIIE